MVDKQRVRQLNQNQTSDANGPVVYWMSRDQRAKNNWALLYALELANKNNVACFVAFTLAPQFLEATWRQYHFMIEGLKETESTLQKHQIPFYLLVGNPVKEMAQFINHRKAAHLVCDFDPLRIKTNWKQELLQQLKIPFWEVDAHNIVPCWQTSAKQEFAAYTIRPKIKKQLNQFLTTFPEIQALHQHKIRFPENRWNDVIKNLKINHQVQPVKWALPGSTVAEKTLSHFLNTRLPHYNKKRNDPNEAAQSDLSPYLHFGQISAQHVSLQAISQQNDDENRQAFLEELIVRRELSDNYCFYNPDYDNINGAPNWALQNLENHRLDEREHLYSTEQFEKAQTHDPLWNAAQLQMVNAGKMHGYMRMYWAKKILEWTNSIETALETAIYLNDKYELDGRDPNGYTGCQWSITGLHDRPWAERPVFGKIRYMNYNGCKRKFNTDQYLQRWSGPSLWQ